METYKVAGIDVHKKMLAVVVTDAAAPGEFHFERRKFGTLDSDLKALAQYLAAHGVQEVVMESTAQYWKPVWLELETQCKLHLAQAQSNRAPRGRKRDFKDAERLVRRYIAGELILSFVPDAEQRLWRTVTRSKLQLTEDRVRLRNQMESLLEDARIKLATCVSDLLGLSSRRILRALADGERNPETLAKLADKALQATPEKLQDALAAAPQLSALHREILGLYLDRVELIDRQTQVLNQSLATALQEHQAAVVRLSKMPGYGGDSSQQVIAEVGPKAATFPSAGEMASWVGCSPGREESAEESTSNRSPKGNRQMRRVLTQVAQGAVRTKGSVFERLYRRLLPKKGHAKAMWAVVHRICRLTWKILHEGVEYEERGVLPDPRLLKQRTTKLVRQLKQLGYDVRLTPLATAPSS